MSRVLIDRLLTYLVQHRKSALAGHLHAPYSVQTFLLGVRLGAKTMLAIEHDQIARVWDKVVEERGWNPKGKWIHMQLLDRGLDASEGAAELVAIEIDLWQKMRNELK